MALYHFHIGQIGRAKGYSSVAAAAYRSGEKLYCDYYGETHDYTKKRGVLHEEIMFPDYMPERFKDRETLWNELEKQEKHPKAQLCYSFDIALQNELSYEENLELARRMEKQYRTDFSDMKKEYAGLQERNTEIDSLIGSLYADKTKGIISEKRFIKMMGDLEAEQTDNETKMQDLSKQLSANDAKDSEIRLFISEIRKTGVIKELDEIVLNHLIDKIYIGEVRKVDGEKVQEVKIIYNFVGEVSMK